MTKRLVKYFWALPLLGMLSGCSDSAVNEGSQNASNAIQFAVTASKQTTKATAVDNEVVRDATKPFGLFAYSNSGWTQGTAPTGQPNFMYDQEVKYDAANGGWTYTPLKFWTNDKISFFGYWPKDACTTAKADDGKMPEVEFTQNMTATDMIDFITSNNALNKTKADGVVTLEFNHVLTRVNFQARLDQNLGNDSKTHVYIKSLKVLGKGSNQNSKLYNKGTFVLGDGGATDGNGHWELADANIETADLDLADILDKKPYTSTVVPDLNTGATYSVNGVQVSDNGEATELLATNQTSAKQEYLFLIPPTKNGIENADEAATPNAKADIKVMLDYDVVSEDPNIPQHLGVVTENTGVVVPLKVGSLAQGKAYNVIFTVGLYAVKVDVDVKDWVDDVTSHAPSVDIAGNTETDIITAWEKMNNVKAENSKANYFVIKVDKTPTGDLDLRTNVDAGKADLSAFRLGDQVELLFADDETGASYAIESKVTVPNGWVCEDREVGGTGVKRHIMTKVADYVTEVPADNTAGSIVTSLTKLNTAHKDDVHYYAVNIYDEALAALDLKAANPAPVLTNFGANDYIYIIFKTDSSDKSSVYTAPDGWEIVSTKTTGKYRLQLKSSSTTGTSANIAAGDAGFTIPAVGGTINVNK